jgi:hypothetical protein
MVAVLCVSLGGIKWWVGVELREIVEWEGALLSWTTADVQARRGSFAGPMT